MKRNNLIILILVAAVCVCAVAGVITLYRGNHISKARIEKAILAWAVEEYGESAGAVGYSEITQYRYENQNFSRILPSGTVLQPYLIFIDGSPRAVVCVETHSPESVRAYRVDYGETLLDCIGAQRFTILRCDASEPKGRSQIEPFAYFEDGTVIGLSGSSSPRDPGDDDQETLRAELEQAIQASSTKFVFTELQPQVLLKSGKD